MTDSERTWLKEMNYKTIDMQLHEPEQIADSTENNFLDLG